MPGLGEADVDNDQFEFIEVMNVGSEPIDLAGVQLSGSDPDPLDRLNFTFAPTPLSPNERVVVVRNVEAFASRYGTGLNLAGLVFGQAPERR